MGNHEFYKFYDTATLTDGMGIAIRNNVHSYYNAVVHLNRDIDVIVSTLWSKIPPDSAYYNEHSGSDFRQILYHREPLTPAAFNHEHERCLAFVKDAIEASHAKRKIVLAHHLPSFRMQNPTFAGSANEGAFAVELEDYITGSGIGYWIYGHSHYNVDVKIGNTLCTSNQLGYVFRGEHKTFDHSKCIVIES